MEIVYDIGIVGCGGTGGNLIKELGRFLKFFSSPDKSWTLTLIDGDRVEAKNGSRQPFSVQDVQQMKALVMQEGLVECLELPGDKVFAYPEYLDTPEQLSMFMTNKSNEYETQHVKVLVGCVDNHRARQVMHQFFEKQPNIIYIDAANEYDSGEVVIGIRIKGEEIAPPRAFYFPEVLTDTGKSASELSCGVVNISSPQHIITNLCAAQHSLSAIVQLMQKDEVEGGIIHFNAFTHFSRFDRWTSDMQKDKAKEESVKKRSGKKVG